VDNFRKSNRTLGYGRPPVLGPCTWHDVYDRSMSDLALLIQGILVDLPAAVSGSSRDGYRVRYTAGHPVYPDQKEFGRIRITQKDRNLEYADPDGYGFVIRGDLIRDVQFHADTLVVVVGLSGDSLMIHFDASTLREGARRRLIKQLRLHSRGELDS
jgi:hypothetical protein